jgi:hypothetical protein
MLSRNGARSDFRAARSTLVSSCLSSSRALFKPLRSLCGLGVVDRRSQAIYKKISSSPLPARDSCRARDERSSSINDFGISGAEAMALMFAPAAGVGELI